MARTMRISRDWRTKTTNHRDQMGCGRGKGCGVCGSLERYSDKRREAAAQEAIVQVWA